MSAFSVVCKGTVIHAYSHRCPRLMFTVLLPVDLSLNIYTYSAFQGGDGTW